eukprot:TRINITY_DN3431_c0_g1_i1.p1 TRINITY_DN3431_c0_g1~~TRINITY_DN3431_c0_g1_i1.p1  ORF type:complete len:285 (+),score=35.23 TRINITY_DN3431_c0_g1_i1:135-989(+)
MLQTWATVLHAHAQFVQWTKTLLPRSRSAQYKNGNEGGCTSFTIKLKQPIRRANPLPENMNSLSALPILFLFFVVEASGDDSGSPVRVSRGIFVPRIPFSTTSMTMESCLMLNGKNVISEPFSFDFEAADALFACSVKNGGLVTHYPAKLSLFRSEFVCEESALISYIDDDNPVQRSPFHLPFVCVGDFCVFYSSIGDRVFLSAAVLPEEAPELAEKREVRIPFLATEVLFDFDDDMVKKFGEAQATAFGEGVTGSVDLRAMSFLGVKKAPCRFPRVSCSCSRR